MPGHLLLLNIAGGVALLLWATRMVRTGILRAYGSDLRRLLGRSTRNRLNACAIGVGIAGLLQSSTATALLSVSFAGRGLVATAPALAIMLGADIGSTLVVQVLSFDISWLSPVLVLIGVTSFLAGPSTQWRHIGRVFIGLGLMLLALTLVVDASEPLRDSAALGYVLQPLSNDPILAVLLAALITWLAHSSVAIVLLIMSLTVAGVVPMALGFALVLGANIGSGLIPVALTVSSPPQARRIPLGNLIFRTIGALAVLPLVDLAIEHIVLLGPEPGRQIANFHTLFNLALAAVFLGLTDVMARITERLMPESREAADTFRPKYLDPEVIDQPSVAIGCATREVMRMADTVETMLRGVIEVFRTDDSKQLSQISAMDDEVDRLHEAVKLYLTQVSRNALNDEDSRRCIDLISFTTNLEHIGDIIDKNLLDLAQKKIRNKLSFSEAGWQELTELHGRVMNQLQLALSVFVSADLETARQLIKEKERFRTVELELGQKHLERLRSGQVESIETSALHLDMLRDLKRINSHLTSVAYPILDASGALRPSRLRPEPELETEGVAAARAPDSEPGPTTRERDADPAAARR
ncbi:MAG TPA: Na/Pi cotransporter family protein [Kiloniellales bacterium]|nr:Na/Pi cotransporter family protein [Kiloniellales bacterium]